MPYWRIEWLDKDNRRRVDWCKYDTRDAGKWTTYIRNVGGRVTQMTVSSTKGGPQHVVPQR